MGYPNSVEEIDNGLSYEGLDMLDGIEKDYYNYQRKLDYQFNKLFSKQEDEFGYWLDNCGDGELYCKHCLQPKCEKEKMSAYVEQFRK